MLFSAMRLKNLTPPPKTDTEPPEKPERMALPADLSRVDVRHEPDATADTCGSQLKRISEDVTVSCQANEGKNWMGKIESQNHTKWDCKYHVMFILKNRRKVLYGQLRMHLERCFAGWRSTRKADKGGAFDGRSRAHDDRDTGELCGIDRS